MSEVIINNGDWLKITHPPSEEGGDGEVVYVRIKNTNISTSTNPNNTSFPNYSDTIGLDVFNSLGMKRVLNWHNCYSFGNGVESNRIADIFNMPQITPGVKVSTIFEEYKEEHRKHGLIYSGLYNSTSGVNNLNQFIQAEKITKDINPMYGSIQKLYTRDTDLITLCEDKVLRILANKDALYNADGNPQLVATENVLGQAVPFVGEYGISKNPESFVSEAYRSYFTDKQRGAVMRLSRDGLTPISMHGMKDWFRDNLSTSRVNLLGEDNLNYGLDNWDIPGAANLKIENGVATIGYFNNDIESNKYGLSAKLRKNNILKVGHRYRFQCDTIVHSGLEREETLNTLGGQIPMIQVYPTLTLAHGEYITGSGEAAWNAVNVRDWRSYLDNYHIDLEFTAASTDIEINQLHVNSASPVGYYTPPGGTQQTIASWVESQRVDPVENPYTWGGDYLYGSIVTIKNLILEEIKVEPKIFGSYDDRQDEYNVTIRGATWKTLSFREDVTGWVSFKSFVPENAISCANDYYTIKDGKLYQHHVQGAISNNFYGIQTNSTINVILNDSPGSVKSFHALDYEGSQSRVEGVRTVEVTGIQHITGPDGKYFFFEASEMNDTLGNSNWHETNVGAKQYRNNILIYSGLMRFWVSDNTPQQYNTFPGSSGPGKGHGRRTTAAGSASGVSSAGDFEVGDIITTEEQEKTVNHFNSMPKDGWWVSGIETDKQKGSLPEFIEKEGKWFNHIKGIDSDISETTDFGSFDIQGIGIIEGIDGNDITFANNINSSLQIGDTLYFDTSRSQSNTVEVIGVNPIYDVSGVEYYPTQIGKYFTFTEEEMLGIYPNWSNTINAPGQPGINAPIEIEQYRDDVLVFQGEIDVNGTWSSPNPSGRRESGPWNAGDFQVGDIIIKKDFQNLPFPVFGFTRLESGNIQKFGTVMGLTNNTINVDVVNGIMPSSNDYILFSKNQAVNTSSLLGYYADVRLENNSKHKAEIFSLSSEITESSK